MCRVGDDYWDLYSDAYRKARKVHRCGECRRAIAKGERYHFATGLMDGYWSTFHTCEQCDAARVWLEVVCDGWLFEDTRDDLGEHYAEEEFARNWPMCWLLVGGGLQWQHHGALVPVERVREMVGRALAPWRQAAAA